MTFIHCCKEIKLRRKYFNVFSLICTDCSLSLRKINPTSHCKLLKLAHHRLTEYRTEKCENNSENYQSLMIPISKGKTGLLKTSCSLYDFDVSDSGKHTFR